MEKVVGKTAGAEAGSVLKPGDKEQAAAVESALLDLMDRGLVHLLDPNLLSRVLASDPRTQEGAALSGSTYQVCFGCKPSCKTSCATGMDL